MYNLGNERIDDDIWTDSVSRKSIIKLGTKYNPQYAQMTVKHDGSETSTLESQNNVVAHKHHFIFSYIKHITYLEQRCKLRRAEILAREVRGLVRQWKYWLKRKPLLDHRPEERERISGHLLDDQLLASS